MTVCEAPVLLRHPGPMDPVRIHLYPAHTHRVSVTVPRGVPLVEGLWASLHDVGASGGVATLHAGSLAQLGYHNPAPSQDGSHAIWFSEPRVPDVLPAGLLSGSVTLGRRDAQPYMHCHCIFEDDEGRRGAGHVIPETAVVGDPVEATVDAFLDVDIAVHEDAETRFPIFRPHWREGHVPEDTADQRPGAVCVWLRPNEDLVQSAEKVVLAMGVTRAEVSGVGSLAGAALDGGGRVGAPAVQVVHLAGEIVVTDDGSPRSRFDATVVDMDGVMHEGRLLSGHNPVAVTFEMVIRSDPDE